MEQTNINPFNQLKASCTLACHKRQACKDGFKAMMEAEDVASMMGVWRENWEDVVESKYADIICEQLPSLYSLLRVEMNKAGIYLNECPRRAPSFVHVLITNSEEEIHIYDNARAYVLGKAKVVAHEHAQVYSVKQVEANITLMNHSYGYITAGIYHIQDHASVRTH